MAVAIVEMGADTRDVMPVEADGAQHAHQLAIEQPFVQREFFIRSSRDELVQIESGHPVRAPQLPMTDTPPGATLTCGRRDE